MMGIRDRGIACVVTAFLLGGSTAGLAADASFSEEQARKGRAAYNKSCSECHGVRLEGEHLSPPLVGSRFDVTWRDKSAGVLAFHLRRMPPDPRAGTLGDEVYANILAYILKSNGFEAGDALPTAVADLDDIDIPQLAGADYEPDAPEVAAGESERLANMSPVTAAMLRDPAPQDWLQTQASYNAQTFSKLEQINKDSVANLAIAWRQPLRAGVSMPMPVVHDGIMFLHSFPDTVLAIDATNGDILWRHQYKPDGPSSQKLGIALAGDKVLVPTSDLHVLALSSKTGELIWDHTIRRESDAPAAMLSYNLRSAPLVVGDKLIQPVTASFVPKGGFLVAIDIESGEEAWRFHTIARPGTPGGETWNDVPLDKRSGGSIWQTGSYDPELNMVFYGTAPTYDTGPLVNPVDKAGVSSEALYTNSTIAINPDNGELVWHYQHMSNDQWDLDWVFERQIIDLPLKGETRRVVLNVGKVAIVEAVDAKTGRYLFSVDAGIQNVITDIDPETGEKTYDLALWPGPDKEFDVCPSAFGARSWPPTSYSPQTQMLYLPLTESCMHMGKEGGRLLTSGLGISGATHPESADGKVGRLQAIDLASRKRAWLVELEGAVSTGALATAGGIVFVGDTAPSLKAFDDATGEMLWEKALDDNPSSSVITYSVDGTQYVAIVAGVNNFHIGALAGTLGSLLGGGGESDGPPKGGAAIWVFSL
ncbi:MAG: PQQ-binding-like beta-propeller repeat protein [Acidobacteriota bacterium]|nr:PQQ-binding-like beta-propeller repeat protein [Acidobacteriota bacterium]